MKRRVFILMLLVLVFLFVGCSIMQASLVELSREDIKNAELTREAAKNFLSTWNINSGFVRGSLGERINEFPVQFLYAMDELDKIANREGELSDYDLGYSLGLRVRTLEAIVQRILKTFAPDVLDLIPFSLIF